MKRYTIPVLLSLFALASFSTVACRRSSDEVWSDTRSAGRHVKRGVGTLGGKHGESRMVKSSSDFNGEAKNDDFVSIDPDAKNASGLPQPKESPGDLGSSIPAIDAFKDPAQDPALAPIFKHIHFDYNSSLIGGDENLSTAQKIASFMKNHPNMYVFVEGHCDKRGPTAYNYALGANRAASIRELLAKEGVNAEHLFTISYGKDKPIAEGDTEESYFVNRRGQFRVWEK